MPELTPTVQTTLGTIEAIYKRRAVRSYAAKPVGRGTIEKLLDAAVHAPTAVHEEPWAFVVIEDPQILRSLSDDAKKSLGEIGRSVRLPGESHGHHFSPPDNIFYNAAALIVIYGKPLGRFVVADCWLAAENLMLAAVAMGLGTCVIGLAVEALNAPEWKLKLGIPNDFTAFAPIIVGIPAGETPETGRRKPEVIAWK
jgi:nitroreductase